MVSYFISIIGAFVFDDQYHIKETILFRGLDDYENKEGVVRKLKKKYPDIQPVPETDLTTVLTALKDTQYFQQFYQQNSALTKRAIKESVNEDHLIVQAIANINEIDKVNNIFTKRLREWFSLYFPELSENVANNETFVQLVKENTRSSLMKEFGIKETMGADLSANHVKEMVRLAEESLHLFSLRKHHEAYLNNVMQRYCPNVLALAGVTIGAKLIELAKGLKRLALLPASTIQLLGAEKALFRHITIGTKAPKYGIIMNHPLVQRAKKDEKGKAARMLADKLSLCARLDFFTGEFNAPRYKEELEKKFITGEEKQ
jgi:nucleolar protein 56